MDRMGNHSHPNGHRGDDGSAAVLLPGPVIGTAFEPRRVILTPWKPSPDGAGTAPEPVRAEHWWTVLWRVIREHRGWLAAVPVVLVNVVAFGAQLGFWRVHVPAVAEAVLVALALESIAIYLAWQAHLAQLADDAALRLRLSAYGMALIIGALNYSHFMGPGWRPTVEAVTFGMMSAVSPWLWSVHSRRVSRDALKARGLIEPHAVRLGMTRWAWHPGRSVRVMSYATWAGETDPAAAVAAWRPRKARKVPDVPADASPVEPEDRHEAVSEAVSVTSAPPSADVKPQPRKRTTPPSARAKALAIMRANPGLSDPEVMKRAKASKSTVERARRELAGASS